MAVNRLVLVGVGLAAVGGILLLSGTSKAAAKPKPGPTPDGGKKGGFPPGTALATVATDPSTVPVGLQPGVRLNNVPKPRASGALAVGADIPNGTIVGVLETDIREIGAAAGALNRWWKLLTADGRTGYARAIDANGSQNFRPTGDVPLPAPKAAAVSGMGAYPLYAAHPTVPYRMPVQSRSSAVVPPQFVLPPIAQRSPMMHRPPYRQVW